MQAAAVDAPTRTIVVYLLPFTLAIFLGYLAIGIPVAVLPGYVHDTLGFGSIVTGIAVGLQPASTLLSRRFAGRLTDVRGAKYTALAGFFTAALASLCYVLSVTAEMRPILALTILLAGRILLGLGESLFLTALVSWSIARTGTRHTGRAMAWSGIAMYAALATGAPAGVAAGAASGFAAVAALGVLCPLLGAGLILRWSNIPGAPSPEASFVSALRAIWMPGLALALASSGVGTITAFLALRFQMNGWPAAGGALSAFGGAYLLVRFLGSGLPDRLGGYRTAAISLLLEAGGLAAIWLAGSQNAAFAGAMLAGAGYSLVFPSLGVEALRNVAAGSRGMVLGAYLACFDLGLAVSGPAAGAAIQSFGPPGAFATAGLAAIAGLALTLLSWSRIKKGHTNNP